MKILVVLPRFPYPLDKGDKLRAYHQIVELSKRHEIFLFALSHSNVTPSQLDALRPHCREIAVVTPRRIVCYWNILRNYFRAKSLQMGYWDSRRARRTVKEMVRHCQPDVVYNQMVRTVPLVARLPLPKVMDFQDSLSLNTERRMEQSRGLWRSILHYEFKMLRSTEYNAFKIFDGLTIISEADSDAIPHKRNGEISIVPNGVDFDYFNPTHNPQPTTNYTIVFCGNMSYAPNVDAAHYLANEIMPLVWQQHPEATLLLAGADPKPSVRNLASNRVTVSGRIEDIRQAYASASIFVAPMRMGSGLQNKLLEAMAMQLPCVTTPLANDALRATPGSHILIGDTPAQLAQCILQLLGSDEQRAQLANNGHSFVLQHYSWQSAVQPLEKLLNAVVSK